LVAVCADRRIVPVTNWPLTVMVSAAASPRVVLPVLLSVVNVPASGVVAPIDILLMVPAVPELIVIVPAPVVVYDWLLVVVLNVVAPVAVKAVNVPARAVVAPIDMLLIVPAVPELIVIVPAPVVVYDCALVVVLMVTAPVADNVVNAPVDAVVAPIDMLLIVPTPVEVKASVGVVLAVNVIKFV